MKMIRSNIKFVIPCLTCIVFLLICYYNKDNNRRVEVLHHDNSENVKYFKDRNNLVNVLSGSVANNGTSHIISDNWMQRMSLQIEYSRTEKLIAKSQKVAAE